MNLRLIPFALLALSLSPAAARSQEPLDSAAVPAYDALTGLYRLVDDRLISVSDLIDRTGEHQLMAIEPQSGRTRTLYPVTATPGVRPGSTFESGAGWFVRAPVEYTLRFTWSGDSLAGIVMEDDGQTFAGRRVHFRQREATFDNGDVRLSGTLVLPNGPGPHPVLVFVHGSGPVTRLSPRYLGELFAERGMAALVFDKRGTGRSTGSWQNAAYEDLAGDVSAAVAWLRAQPDVDSSRIGLFGSSEAGFVVPLVAARAPVALIVCRVCAALPRRVIEPLQQQVILRNQGFSPAEIAEAAALHTDLIAYAVERTGYAELEAAFNRYRDRPWMQRRYRFAQLPPPEDPYWTEFRAALTVDPRTHYQQLDIPILFVLGEADDLIDVEANGDALRQAARRAGNTDLSIEVLDRANHGLFEVQRGADGEQLPFERMSPRFHSLVLDWVASHFF